VRGGVEGIGQVRLNARNRQRGTQPIPRRPVQQVDGPAGGPPSKRMPRHAAVQVHMRMSMPRVCSLDSPEVSARAAMIADRATEARGVRRGKGKVKREVKSRNKNRKGAYKFSPSISISDFVLSNFYFRLHSSGAGRDLHNFRILPSGRVGHGEDLKFSAVLKPGGSWDGVVCRRPGHLHFMTHARLLPS